MPRYSSSPRRRRRSRSRSRSPYAKRERRRSRDRSPRRRDGGGRKRDNYNSYDRRREGGRRGYNSRGFRGGRSSYGGRNNNRGRGRRSTDRSGSPFNEMQQQLEKFRFRDLSRERPENDKIDEEKRVELKDKEVAYVFGRMGTTKDKLARVSGAHIDLHGQDLVIQGDLNSVDRAEKYIKILLDQRGGKTKGDRDSDKRSGDVFINPEDHLDDLTFVSVPVHCKGFVTGRNGATLRQIERECATLMTFCKNEQDLDGEEPLAIFGTRRGRLAAQMKVMSIVEAKAEGWYIKDDKPPTINLSQPDLDEGGGWGISSFKLQEKELGYALGQRGATRQKLQIASNCIIQYVGHWALFAGTYEEQMRGKDYLTWLINQRQRDFSVDISERNDVKVIYVPERCVGYVTGKKAQTLRNLEEKSGTFCFFDKRKSGRPKEKMLIFAYSEKHRDHAQEEVEMIVNFHQKKTGGFERVTLQPDDDSSRSRSRSKDSRSRSRSGSRARSGSAAGRKNEKSHSRSPRARSASAAGRKNEKAHSRSRSYSRSRSQSKDKKTD